MTVGELTERDLIARIQARLPPAPEWMIVGIGDDAAVVEPERNRVEVLTVDAMIEGIHFDRRFTPGDAIGHRALASNLSDLAAMGATPRLALLSFALPAGLGLDEFDGMVAGIAGLAARYTMHVAGGNLTRSPGPLVVDITVMGTVKRRQALTRAGARPGDELYVTGAVGAAGAGLQMLLAGEGTERASVAPHASPAVERYLRPDPRVRAGQLLSRNRVASAAVDLSDGLADGLYRIAGASGVGMIVSSEELPIDAETRGWFSSRGEDAVERAITAGDDYELLFTVHPRQRKRLAAVSRHAGIAVTRIGVCVPDGPPLLRSLSGGHPVDRMLPDGYTHFR